MLGAHDAVPYQLSIAQETDGTVRLAAEGMKFNQFYCGANVCAPSRSVLMTGLHTGHTPVRNNGMKRFLYDEDVTTAEAASRTEYEPQFRQLELKAWELSAYSVASNVLLQDNAIGLEQFLLKLFAKVIAWTE